MRKSVITLNRSVITLSKSVITINKLVMTVLGSAEVILEREGFQNNYPRDWSTWL